MKAVAKKGLIVAICLLAILLFAHLFGFGSDAGKDDASASFNVGKTETHSSLFSSTTSSSGGNATFNSRRVLFVSANPHPLSQRIGRLVIQRLTNCPSIEQVELAKSPEMLPEGAEKPDLFLRIELASLKEEGLLSGSMKAVVTGFLGSAPWQSTHHSIGPTTPPLVVFGWNATSESDSTFKGIRSDRYAAIARSAADELAKSIRTQLETLSAKYPALPELPRDFYGPYQPVADFDFLDEVKARRACSYYGLLSHNETFWRFQTATNPVPQLQSVMARLEAAGWKVSDASLTNTEDYMVRARQGDAELEFFRLRDERVSLPPVEKKEIAMEFVAHYRKPFLPAEREAAFDKLFTEPHPIEALLPFQHSFSPAQRDKFFALVEKTPEVSPLACVQIAESYFNRKQTNSAVHLLLRAKALASSANDCATVESEIETLAKKISPKTKLQVEATPEICRELGFLEITNGPQTFELQRDIGRPLLMFGVGDHGLEIVSLTIQPPRNGVYPWALTTQTERGSRSTSSSSFDLKGRRDLQQMVRFGRQTLKVTAVFAPDGKHVKYGVRSDP